MRNNPRPFKGLNSPFQWLSKKTFMRLPWQPDTNKLPFYCKISYTLRIDKESK